MKLKKLLLATIFTLIAVPQIGFASFCYTIWYKVANPGVIIVIISFVSGVVLLVSGILSKSEKKKKQGVYLIFIPAIILVVIYYIAPIFGTIGCTSL